MRCVLMMTVVLLASASARGDVHVVHPDGTGEWPTIQAAVEACQAGDIVELTTGTFVGAGNRDVDFLGKAVTIRSQSGDPLTCAVDCQGTEQEPRRGFLFRSGEGPGSVLQGLTVTNGVAWHEINGPEGGAVYCGAGSGPTIVDCRFVGNRASGPPGGGAGGAVACLEDSAPVFLSCTFVGNGAYFGGAIHCEIGSAPCLTGCHLHENNAYMGGGVNFRGSLLTLDGCTISGSVGCGVVCCSGSIAVTNCTLYGNDGGALHFAWDADPTLDNTLIVFNGVWCDDVVPAFSCCDIYGNGQNDWVPPFDDQLGVNGNISQDPMFCSASPEDDLDWSIHADSPCAPESSGCGLIGAWGVGCGDSPVRTCTWGEFKATYGRRGNSTK